jgi:two-component system, NtrC family, sensor histidine kinase HydH
MTSRDSQSLVTNIQQQTDTLFRQLAEVLNQPDSGARRDDVRRLVDGLLDTMIRDVEQLHAVNLETLAASRSRLLTVGDKVAWGLLALGVCGAVSGLLAGFSVARKVVTQLASSEQAVMRADQLASMGQLAAGLAHEVRNPLMIMRLLIDTAAPNQSGRIEGRDLAVLDQEISRLEILVESFSDFARPPQPEPVEFDVQEMLSEIEQLTDATALQNDVTMQIEASAGPLLIYADRGQLRQLVLNLVINAINAQSDGGSIRLAAHRASAGIPVSLRQQVDDPGILRLSVTDTGPGIAADLTDQVFEPFYSTRETGLGLGLSICRRIVESHGGLIDVEHDGDVGAKFIVWLPLSLLPAGNRNKKADHGESADHR